MDYKNHNLIKNHRFKSYGIDILNIAAFFISPGAVVGRWVAVVFRRSLRGSRPPPHLRVRAANGVTPELPVE